MAAGASWTLKPGESIRRSALHDKFGGNRQGGIAPSAQAPEVFVFTTPSGHLHGYTDRLREDGLFHYTGQGQTGDQKFDRANLALLEHKQRGTTVRVFLGVSGTTTYVGEFEVDQSHPFYWQTAPSTGGGPERRVIVFRLRPTEGAATPLLQAIDSEARFDDLPTTGPWSRQEVAAAVRAYVAMLQDEAMGRPYSPADVVHRLRAELPGRASESIQQQLRGISAVLEQEGAEWIEEYEPKPLRELPPDIVHEHMGPGHAVRESLAAYEEAASPPQAERALATDDVLVSPPSVQERAGARSRVGLTGGPLKAMNDFRIRRLGTAGERWVLDLERENLARTGRADLADKIRWTAREDGDGAGYDIQSYRPDGRVRLIEVKTTNLGVRTPFYITRHEIDVSVDHPEEYSLYRVHGFHRDPRIYILDGSVEETARLEPRVFLGVPR